MMKKLLALTLVLGMVSLTPAAIQISIDGNTDPIDSEITIMPSDTLVLDVHDSVGSTGLFWMYVVDAATGSLDAANATTVGAFSRVNEPAGYGYLTGYFQYYAGLSQDVYGNPALSAVSGVTGDTTPLVGVIVDGIIFHAEAPGDAIIQLWGSDDGAAWALVDSAVVHIPEPMTMALLGLGGLLLSRKK